MQINEYQRLAMRTSPCNGNENGDMLNHAFFGLTSVAGEVAGIFQKVYQGREIDPEHLKKELGDVCWMVAEACTALGFDLEDVMQTNIDKLRKRFPNGFDIYRDQHRDKDDV